MGRFSFQAMLTKVASDSRQEHVEPKDADLELIRKQTQRDLAPDEVYVVRQKLANDRYDRAHERFPVEYLERFAATIPGKSLLIGHDYTLAGIGRYFKASVQKDDHGHYLDAYSYLDSEEPAVRKIQLGIWRDVSIGYNAGKRVCDLCEKAWSPYGSGKDACEHWPGADFDGKTCTLTYCPTEAHKAEAMEGSFVWAGCQPGAEAVAKSAQHPDPVFNYLLKQWRAGLPGAYEVLDAFLDRPHSSTGEHKMTVEEIQAQLLEAKAAHQTEAEQLKKELATLKARADEGEAYREHLKGEIKRMADALEVVEPGTAAQYGTFLEILKAAPVDQIMPTYERIQTAFNAKFSKGSARTDVEPAPEPNTKADPTWWGRRRAAAR